jgi:hypothetical protein
MEKFWHKGMKFYYEDLKTYSDLLVTIRHPHKYNDLDKYLLKSHGESVS